MTQTDLSPAVAYWVDQYRKEMAARRREYGDRFGVYRISFYSAVMQIGSRAARRAIRIVDAELDEQERLQEVRVD